MATQTIVVGIQSLCSIAEFKLCDNSLPGKTSGAGIRSAVTIFTIFKLSLCLEYNYRDKIEFLPPFNFVVAKSYSAVVLPASLEADTFS